MKKICILLLALLLMIRLIYPYTRFGYRRSWSVGFSNRLNIESATLKPGEKVFVKIVGFNKRAKYSSSDFRIASVSFFGIVCAHQPGTAIISVQQGSRVYKCKITVIRKTT